MKEDQLQILDHLLNIHGGEGEEEIIYNERG